MVFLPYTAMAVMKAPMARVPWNTIVAVPAGKTVVAAVSAG
jgi:hypothetical protein